MVELCIYLYQNVVTTVIGCSSMVVTVSSYICYIAQVNTKRGKT